MSKINSPALLPWMGISLTTAVLLSLNLPVQAAGKQASLPERDFLPPVASINPKLVENQPQQTDDDVEAVDFHAVNTPVLRTTPKVETLSSDLSAQVKGTQVENVLEIQKKVDEADLEYLWQATVEKNPVIRFSLEKLAAPPDLQTKQSSRFMTKTLNMLISGATLGSTMLPGGTMYRNMGSMAVANALQNMVSGKTTVNPNTLTATEQIQLAGLIDELKVKLIHNYQDYKNTLENLTQSHAITVKNNSVYSKALASKNDLAIMAAGTAYYQALSNETTLRQKAKMYRMQLERLAGTDAVTRLELVAHIPDTAGTASSATASANMKTVPPAASLDLIGPLPMETTFPSTTEKSADTLIGPELPPAKVKSAQKTAKKSPAVLKNEIPQPLEIGPTLRQSRYRESGVMSGPTVKKAVLTLEPQELPVQ